MVKRGIPSPVAAFQPQLVGRGVEPGAVEHQLSRAFAGKFRVVLLTGAAGVGTSRLGRRSLRRAGTGAATLEASGKGRPVPQS